MDTHTNSTTLVFVLLHLPPLLSPIVLLALSVEIGLLGFSMHAQVAVKNLELRGQVVQVAQQRLVRHVEVT